MARLPTFTIYVDDTETRSVTWPDWRQPQSDDDDDGDDDDTPDDLPPPLAPTPKAA